MKTDEKYIYPESAEELAMFYGFNCQNLNGLNAWHDYGVVSDETMKRQLDGIWPRFRIPLPTINELKVGDVVRYAGAPNSVELWQAREQQFKDGCDITGVFGPISLLIGRNTWVPVKCD